METVVGHKHTLRADQEDLSLEIARIYQKQQEFFASGATRSYAFRKEQLKKIQKAIQAYDQRIIDALNRDFRKSAFESFGTEIGPLLTEMRHTLRDLRNWMRPERVGTPLPFLPSSSWTYADPLGVTLIISPWCLNLQRYQPMLRQ